MTDTRNTLLATQTRFDDNRVQFAEKIEAQTKGQRGGLFSIPINLTVGDASTNYQCDRKAADKVGKSRSFANGRGRATTTDTFNKLVSNAIGDEYNDSGRYFLRQNAGKKAIAGPFAPSGKGKLVRKSEFSHMKEFDHKQPGPKSTFKNCTTSTHTGSFQKMIPYIEDAYERKEDMRRLDYQRRAQLVLDKNGSFRNTVRQHGAFDPSRTTYGSDRKFPNKLSLSEQKPSYGAFRIGDLPKKGHEKALNAFPYYTEDPQEDTVYFQKDI